MSGDIDKTGDGRIISRFRDHSTTVRVSDKNARSVLQRKHAFW